MISAGHYFTSFDQGLEHVIKLYPTARIMLATSEHAVYLRF